IDDLQPALRVRDLAQRLVLPRQMRITDSLKREARRGTTRTFLHSLDMLKEGSQIGSCICLAATTRGDRSPGRECGKLAVARRARVRSNHLQPGREKVRP